MAILCTKTKLRFLLPIELRSYTDTENSKTGSNSDSDSKTSDTTKTVIATKGDLSYTDSVMLRLSNGKRKLKPTTCCLRRTVIKFRG